GQQLGCPTTAVFGGQPHLGGPGPERLHPQIHQEGAPCGAKEPAHGGDLGDHRPGACGAQCDQQRTAQRRGQDRHRDPQGRQGKSGADYVEVLGTDRADEGQTQHEPRDQSTDHPLPPHSSTEGGSAVSNAVVWSPWRGTFFPDLCEQDFTGGCVPARVGCELSVGCGPSGQVGTWDRGPSISTMHHFLFEFYHTWCHAWGRKRVIVPMKGQCCGAVLLLFMSPISRRSHGISGRTRTYGFFQNGRGEKVERQPSTHHGPADPLHPVRGRILLHVKSVCRAPLDHVSAKTGGVIFSGKGARNNIQQFTSKAGHDCPTILDPSAYEDSYATAEEPFTL